MKEQDMIHKLTEEEIPIPESIRPENIYKQLLKVDEERKQGFLPQKDLQQRKRQQRRGYIMGKKAVSIGIAVEAGLLICLLAAGQIPVKTPFSNNSAIQEAEQPVSTVQEETGANRHYGKENVSVEDYQAVFGRLQSIAKQREEELKKLPLPKKNGALYENVEMYTNEATADYAEVAAEDSSAGSGSAATSETNVRTEGVDEGDIVKTDGKYIYTYRAEEKSHCYIYSAEQGKTQKVATISLEHKSFYDDIEDMYLSKGKLVLVVTRSIDSRQKKAIRELYEKAGGDYQNFCKESWLMPGYAQGCVVVESDDVDVLRTENPTVNYSRTLIYDISDPTSPVLEKELFQDGIYESSRIVDGKLYLMSRRYINIAHIDSDKENTFVPQIGGECVSPDKVDMASENEEECYQVLSSVDVASGEYVDKKAVLGGGNQIYVSAKSIYLVDQLSWGGKQTVVMRYSYQDGNMEKEAEGKIEGYLKDDYSLDEQDDYLRVVTTYYNKKGIERNAVYILNDQLKKTGEIKNIAPKESVYAVRFMRELVYFVTYEETDPVFVADLSNPSAPKIIGELKLPGFSSYLHPIGEDLMVGIGSINDEHESGVKLSLFDVSDPKNIKEIHKTVLEEYGISEVMYNPNALFVDAERSLLGFSAEDWDGPRFDYLVYQVDREKGFVRKCKEDVYAYDYNEWDGVRGLYIDDYFYIVRPGRKIKSRTYPDFKKLS